MVGELNKVTVGELNKVTVGELNKVTVGELNKETVGELNNVYFTHMWKTVALPHHFTKRAGLGHHSSLTHPLFCVSVPRR